MPGKYINNVPNIYHTTTKTFSFRNPDVDQLVTLLTKLKYVF